MGQPAFPRPKDAEALARFGRELYRKAMRRVTVLPYRAGSRSEEDEFYGEAPHKDFPTSLAYETPCLIAVLPGWRNELTTFGVDQQRPLTMCFNPDVVVQDGHPLPDVGFHVLSQGDRYRIYQVNPSDWFANIDRSYTHVVLCQRFRPASTSPNSTRPPEGPL